MLWKSTEWWHPQNRFFPSIFTIQHRWGETSLWQPSECLARMRSHNPFNNSDIWRTSWYGEPGFSTYFCDVAWFRASAAHGKKQTYPVPKHNFHSGLILDLLMVHPRWGFMHSRWCWTVYPTCSLRPFSMRSECRGPSASRVQMDAGIARCGWSVMARSLGGWLVSF